MPNYIFSNCTISESVHSTVAVPVPQMHRAFKRSAPFSSIQGVAFHCMGNLKDLKPLPALPHPQTHMLALQEAAQDHQTHCSSFPICLNWKKSRMAHGSTNLTGTASLPLQKMSNSPSTSSHQKPVRGHPRTAPFLLRNKMDSTHRATPYKNLTDLCPSLSETRICFPAGIMQLCRCSLVAWKISQ